MNKNFSHYQLWKLVVWSIIAAGLCALILLPLEQTILFLDDGQAFAQTGPPPPPPPLPPDDDDGTPPPPTPVSTTTPQPFVTITPQQLEAAFVPPPPRDSRCNDQCVLPLPSDLPRVDVEYLDAPPPGVPPLTGAGIIARVPASQVTMNLADAFQPEQPPIFGLVTSTVGIPVPSGYITEPVGLIPFDFGPVGFRELGTLVVPTEPDTDLIVRIQILPSEAISVPIDTPGVIPPDWYVDPHLRSAVELGYGGSMAILAPGVTESNYDRYAARVGLPAAPIPLAGAASAGVIATQPFSGTAVNVEAVFDLSVYNADTGEEITIHLPELILVRCFERNFDPYTPVLLRANKIIDPDGYDIPVQTHYRLTTSGLPERDTAYLLDTATTFVVATMSGAVRPPLTPDQPLLTPNPVRVIPAGPSNDCVCEVPLPPGLPLANIEYLSFPPAGIPPLTGEGVIVRVPATLPITPVLAAIPVPSGFITEPVAVIPFDFGPAVFREFGNLIVPTELYTDLIVRIQILPSEAAIIPINALGVIPTDWYVDPHPAVSELGYGAPLPIQAPGVTESNYERYAAQIGLATFPIPPPDAVTAGVIQTQPLSGTTINIEAVFTLDVYDAQTGEEVDIHLPELILARCFERNYAPYTPVLLRTNEALNRYDIPVQTHDRRSIGTLREWVTAYLLETSTFVIATISGEVRPPLEPGQELPSSSTPASYIPAGLPNTGVGSGISTLLWGFLIVAGAGIVALAIRLRP